MADLELQVPQQMEHRLDALLGPRRPPVERQEHQVDVAERRHFAAPGPAEADDGNLLFIVAGDEVMREANQLVVQIGGRSRRGAAAVGVGAEPAGDLGAAFVERVPEDVRASAWRASALSAASSSASERRSMIARGGSRPYRSCGSSALLGGQPLERVERLERVARAQRVGIDGLERLGQRIGRLLGLGRGEQRQIVEPGRDPAGRVAAGSSLPSTDFARATTRGGNPASLATAIP